MTEASNYSNNSHKAKGKKAQAESPPEKKTEKVIHGSIVERKKPLGKKFMETFVQESTSDLKEYLIFDVAVPAFKNLLLDLIQQGSQRMFYGSSRPNTSRNYQQGGGTQVRYNSMFGGGPGSPAPKTSRFQPRVGGDFGEHCLETRLDAELVLDRLGDILDSYGVVSVPDYYDAIGKTAEFTDHKYGWTNLAKAHIRQTREGYLIEFPQAEIIE